METHLHTCPNCDQDVTHGDADSDISCSDFDKEIAISCKEYDVKFPEQMGDRKPKDTNPLEETINE